MVQRESPANWPQEINFTPRRVSFAVHSVLFEEMLSTGQEEDREVIHPLIEAGGIHPHVKLEQITPELSYLGPHPHPLSDTLYCGRPHYGVFATQEIEAGTDLGEYVGELQVMSSVEEELCKVHDYNWLLKSGPFVYEVRASKWANEIVFVNDYRGLGAEANVSAEIVVHRGCYYLVYRTMKVVQEGEEVLINYGEDYWHVEARQALIPRQFFF